MLECKGGNDVVVWDVLPDLLRADQGGGGKRGSLVVRKKPLLWQCYREDGFARSGLGEW